MLKDTDQPCLLCNQNRLSLLYNKARGGKNVNNYVCNNCGFVFILPRPNIETLIEEYKKGGFSQKARNSSKPSFNKLRQSEEQAETRFNILSKVLDDKIWQHSNEKRASAIEIGCGTGSFLRFLKGAGWQVLGLEPDGAYTEEVQDLYGIEIKNDFLENVKIETKFDLVSSFHVIEHVSDPGKFLNNCYNLLQDDGLLFLECPAIDRIYGGVDFFFWDAHINTFSKSTLTSFLSKAGFEILQYHWNKDFINIIAKKASKTEAFENSFDNSARIKGLVSKNKTGFIKKLKRRFLKVNNAIRRIRERKEEIIIPAANRIYRYMVKRKKYSLLKKRKTGPKTLFHIAFFSRFNGGDILLPVMLRDLIEEKIGGIKWKKQHVHKVVSPSDVKRINQSKGLVIGGGGLFLRDTNPNVLSGWQWPCSMDQLRKISVPLALFAVGYNRFRGQEDFAPIFTEHLRLTAEKSVFIGLRNKGSIEKVKSYLPVELHDKLRFQPCMTTLAAKLYPKLVHRENGTPPFISLNCAFDRSNLRFGDKFGDAMSNIALAMKDLCTVIPVYYYAHSQDDEHFLPFLNSYNVDYRLVKLYNCTPEEVVEAYSRPLIALGMRGHAQLIPFGCSRPIISLISHDKLRFFLDDIDAKEWGLEVLDPDFRNLLYQKVVEMLDNMKFTEDQVSEKMEKLWDISLNNVSDIKNGFGI